ncbi:netrin receptor DCC-like isoform X2 [Centruroides sculpturatus]|uniref:netrin receptor DCC-like isoform X2 n=1 Tax=Centruroides sculpturatus TaxID=218467 RepID=UPI000C6E12FD|nr:netrin receptor DCC-like isoform X2 [Centruroides sculpturatus]
MCRTYHVTIYTPFLIVLLSSCYQAAKFTFYPSSVITNDSSVDNESTETSFTTVSTTTDSVLIPENLTAVAINSNSIRLTWQVSTEAPLLSEFIVIWTKLSNDSTSKNTTVNGRNEIEIGNLDAWTEYRFTVAVLLKDHDVDLRFSANTTERTEPSAPSQLEIHNITSKNTSIFVEWKEPKHPNGPLDGYIIILETEKNENLKNNTYNRSTTLHTFERLNPWTNYTVILIAFNEWNGIKLKTKVDKTVETLYGVPSVPENFSVVTNISTAILTWEHPKNPNGPLDGFRITCRKINDSDLVNETNVDRDVKSYLIDGLAPWTNYSFTIVAYNSNLTSREATAFEKTLADAPSEPREFVVIVKSSRAILFSWKHPEN